MKYWQCLGISWEENCGNPITIFFFRSILFLAFICLAYIPTITTIRVLVNQRSDKFQQLIKFISWHFVHHEKWFLCNLDKEHDILHFEHAYCLLGEPKWFCQPSIIATWCTSLETFFIVFYVVKLSGGSFDRWGWH